VLSRPRVPFITLLPCLLAIILPAPSPGQTTPSDANQRPVFEANARTVVLDVVVIGKDGKPVQGLHKEDFQAAEDGHPQAITSFEEHTSTQPIQAATLPVLPPNVFINVPRVTPTGVATVLLLDSLNTDIRSQSFVRAQMLKYLKGLQPGRPMAIFTLGTRLSLIQGFTDDPAVLTAVVNNLKSGSAPQTSPLLQTQGEKDVQQTAVNQSALDPGIATPRDLRRAAALKDFFEEQKTSQTDMRVRMTLEAFQELAHYLAGIPGRKNLVWFSSAFPLVLFPNRDMTDSFAGTREYGEEVRKTDALLAEAQVAVYPLAAEGLAGDTIYDAEFAPVGATNPAQARAIIGKALKDGALQRNADHTTMDEVARSTGGEAIYNTNGLSDGLARVADLGSYYYTLSYTPTNTAADGRFRKLQVKLITGNDKLAYRRGYYAADAKALRAADTKPAAPPLRPFMGPGMPDSTQIPLALRVQRGAVQADSSAHAGDNDKIKGPLTRYSVDFVIAARGLQFDTAPDGSRHGKMEAAMVIYDQEGKPLNWMIKQVDLDMDAGRYAEVQANGVNFRLEIDVPKDGVSLRSGVYDRESNQTGTLEVPLSQVVNLSQTATASPR
jgi:VWFA-related protein